MQIKDDADSRFTPAFARSFVNTFGKAIPTLTLMTEFELKFEVSPANLKSVAFAMHGDKAKRQRLQASYFDTPDGLLAAHGIVVRLRKEGKRWVQTAKGPTTDVLERLEHNADLLPLFAGAMPELDLFRHRGSPVGRIIDKALGLKAHESYPQLKLLYGTDVQRITKLVTCGESVVEIALDQGSVFTDDCSQSICELEIELKEGVALDAISLARQWCAAHGLWMSTISKSMKGQQLCSTAPLGVVALAMTHKSSPKFSRNASSDEMITAVVQSCLNQIMHNASDVAGGSIHPEHIHQLRVGIRRLRTALRDLGGLTDVIAPNWEAVLAQTFRALGSHRDHSYLERVLQPQLLAAGGPAIRFDQNENAISDIGNAVRAPKFQDALLGLVAFTHRNLTKTTDAPDFLKKMISKRMGKLYTSALRDGKKFLVLSQGQQHGVRKRFKRLRYLMEFSAPLFATRKVAEMTAALKPVQDALGLYNDERIALQALHALAVADPNALFGLGWIAARGQSNTERCLKEIKVFSNAEPFWLK